MKFQIEIPDERTRNFSADALRKLEEYTNCYVLETISEAELLEKSVREDGAVCEITGTILISAVRKNQTRVKKKSKLPIIVGIVSDILIFIAGIMFIPEAFVNNNELNITFLIVFLIIVIVAVTTTIISKFMGGNN